MVKITNSFAALPADFTGSVVRYYDQQRVFWFFEGNIKYSETFNGSFHYYAAAYD